MTDSVFSKIFTFKPKHSSSSRFLGLLHLKMWCNVPDKYGHPNSAERDLRFSPTPYLRIYTLTLLNTAAIFCPPQWFATRRRPVPRPSGTVAGHICVYDSVVHSSKPWNTRHDLQGKGGLRTQHRSPKTNQIQAHKARIGGGKGASHTCCATNGALSGDCWQRELCPSGTKLEVTKTQLNLWDRRWNIQISHQ